MTEKELYQKIADELAAKKTDAALWTQAIVMADGDADKTQAAYIRLRLADLRKSLSPQATPAARAPAIDADGRLMQMRAELKKKLNAQGKTSLYSTLGLQPDASAAVVEAAIADIEAHQGGVNAATAEYRYARDTLSDPAAREAYDRKLLSSLSYDAPPQYQPYEYDHVKSDSWWNSGKTSVLVGVVAVGVIGYLALGFFTERGHHEIQKAVVEVQKDTVGVQRDAVQSAADIERQRIEADAEARQRSASLMADAQRRQMEFQMQMQERQRAADQERIKQQQQQQENMRIQREKQYWACVSQQLDMRGVTSAEASARCGSYR